MVVQLIEKVPARELVKFERSRGRPANYFFKRVGNFHQSAEKGECKRDDLSVFADGFSVV